ncbi:hypothetical protein HCU62_03010 [Dissulfurirhabdus thermomarina]|nr:prenyltransferase/squalene oxidase repeat-containing protein [Dissulfurirhabdus thermomarina]NMX22910.1 hypothetical protein [Dissulfurirhabdus thermomarina]
MRPPWDEIADGVLRFVAARRKAAGGYAATPLLPATAEDTYHALRTLEALEAAGAAVPPPDAGLREWIAGELGVPGRDPRTLYHLCWSARRVGVPAAGPAPGVGGRDTLEARFWRHRLREAGCVAAGPAGAPAPARRPPVVREVWMALVLARAAGEAPGWAAGAAAWVRACQNGDGGFGCRPGTTSFVEHCHTALRVLAMLGAVPRDLAAARTYVLACRTGAGGFARIHGAAAFLDATRHAVGALRLLDRWRPA